MQYRSQYAHELIPITYTSRSKEYDSPLRVGRERSRHPSLGTDHEFAVPAKISTRETMMGAEDGSVE